MNPTIPPRHDHLVSRPSAVMFDLDGTLVDSERVWLDTIRAQLSAAGAAVTQDVLARFEGLATIDAARAVIELGGLSAHETEVARVLEDRTIAAFAGRLPWIAGAEEALGSLRRGGIPLALVTSSTRRWVAAVAENVCLGTFDVVVTADDVSRTKPDAEPYLRAAGLLGMDPGACLVFEDSSVGVRAAMAAGCMTVQVETGDRDAPRPTADRIPDLRMVTASWVRSFAPRSPALR